MDGVDATKFNTKEFIDEGRKKLFDFTYPIYDPNYKNVFETNFIRSFYMREIGFETEGLFKFQLESWLLVNMPYFNKLYESELIEFDPLLNSKSETIEKRDVERDETSSRDTDRTEARNGKNDATSSANGNVNQSGTTSNTHTGSNTSESFQRDLQSDTPDSRLAITTNDGEGVIQYASQIDEHSNNGSGTDKSTDSGKSTNATTSSNTGKQNSTNSENINGNITDNASKNETELDYFIQQRVGKVGANSYSKLLQEYRQTFLRLEKQIFNEMNQLFMLVY